MMRPASAIVLPVLAELALPLAVRPPPPACRRNVTTSDQMKMVPTLRAGRKRALVASGPMACDKRDNMR